MKYRQHIRETAVVSGKETPSMSRKIMFFKLSATIVVYFSIQVSNALLRGSGIWFRAFRYAQGEQGRQCTYKRNIVARYCNHCCCRKALSITY